MFRRFLVYLLTVAVVMSGASSMTVYGETFPEDEEAQELIKTEALPEMQVAVQAPEGEGTYTFGDSQIVTSDSLYTSESGYGFSDVTFPNAASGWSGGVYTPRDVQITKGSAGYVTGYNDYLEIRSKVWTETENTGYGVYTYEETSTFDVDLDNGDYTVAVTLVNPSQETVTANLESEDITKVTDIVVASGGTETATFTACLIDGTLNLKFLETTEAAGTTSQGAANERSVYVSQVTLTRQADQGPGTKPTVYIASDSTVQTYDDYYYPQTGWGQTLYNFFDGAENMVESEAVNSNYGQSQVYETDSAIIENRAIGGRSSKSFVEEGKLDDLLEDIKEGDYLLIQWGHNDATYSRPNRYVSSDDFEQWVQYYVDGAYQRGATPILVTPVARYSPNDDGTFNISFGAYRDVMFDMANEQNIPIVDLGYYSSALCEQFGIEGAKVFFLKLDAGEYDGAYAGGVNDSTHLQYYGAYKFAQIVAMQIKDNASGQLNDLKSLIQPIQTPENVPSQPGKPTMTTIGSSSVTFDWTSSDGAELYYIYRAELEEGQDIEDVDFSNAEKYSVTISKTYTDANCRGGKTYVYGVAGFNEKGVGALSQLTSVTTKSSLYKYDFCVSSSNPTMMDWLQVTSVQPYNAQDGYGWIAAPGNGRYRANNGNADSNDMTDDFTLGTGTFVVDLPNGDYELKITAGDLLPGTSTIKAAYTAEGEAIGGISARRSAGTMSATVQVTDGQLTLEVGGTNPYINGLEITPLSLAPTNFVYQELTFEGSQANFLLNWEDVEDATAYRVYVKSSSDTVYTLLKTTTQEEKDNATTMPYTAILGETYSYYVTAVLSDGTETAPSHVLEIEMVNTDMEAPEAPINLQVVQSETANMSLTWDGVEGAVKYIIYRSDRKEGQKGFKAYEKVDESASSYYTDVDEDVTANIAWYYKVQAVGVGGPGELSQEAKSQITTQLVRQPAETLTDRGVYAIDLSSDIGAEIRTTAEGEGVYLSWRLFSADGNVTFDIYRNGTEIVTQWEGTNYIDRDGQAGDVYRVVGSTDTALGLQVVDTKAWSNQYMEFDLDIPDDQTMPDGTVTSYTANDMSVGDLDGDGQYELIVKWYPNNSQDNSRAGYTGTTILDGYNLDLNTGIAERMWRIDLGINIRSGAHYTQFQVWDMDGDGKAEIMAKTADGTVDGVGTIIGDSNADYRNSSGYVLDGPEYFTIFSGETGAILDTTDYLPARGNVSAWGDGYGNRVDRFLSAVAYLDGVHPYAVFTRGYYTRTAMTAYGFENGELTVHWLFDTDNIDTEEELTSQGNHGLSINDIDHDGKDEIIFGGLTVDHDGTYKYTTELGHGDAMHVSDWVPGNDGLEIMDVHEHLGIPYHVEIHDGETGEILMGYYTGVDTGRGVAADIDPNYIGGEFWANAGPSYTESGEPSWDSTDGGLFSSESTLDNLIQIADETPAANFSIFWDGDLLSEVFDHTFNKEAYYPISINVKDWDYETGTTVTQLESTEVLTSNGTKGNAGLIADILGDWREEIIVRSADDDGKIRLYATTIETNYAIPTLTENFAYREGVAWQNVGYNQPANLSYLLSEGLITARLEKEAVSTSSVSLSFTEASDGTFGHDVEGYEVYRSTEDGDYVLVDTLDNEDLVEVNEDGSTVNDLQESVSYSFDFGKGSVQDGWILIDEDSDAYESASTGYGFVQETKDSGYVTKIYSDSNDPNYDKVYNDCLLGWNASHNFTFNVDVPNGTYDVTFYVYNGSGGQYNQVTIEDIAMSDMRHGNSDRVETAQTVTVEVTDGTLSVVNASSKSGQPAVYFSGLTVESVVEDQPADNPSSGITRYGYTDNTVESDVAYTYKVAAVVDGKTSFMSEPISVKTWVAIQDIVPFEIENLVQDTVLEEGQTVADLLPATVEVIDTEGVRTTTDVIWDADAVDLATPGDYGVTGYVNGFDNPISKTVTVVANRVDGYVPYEPMIIIVGSSIDLPETVVVSYLNQTTTTEEVEWDTTNLDTTTVGVYTIVGVSDSLDAIALEVDVRENYIVSVDEQFIEVAAGKTPTLPATVKAYYADGTSEWIPVIWDTSDLNVNVLGTVVLVGTVQGFYEGAILNVTIDYEMLFAFDFGITSSEVADGWMGLSANPKGGTQTFDALGLTYSSERGYGFTDGTLANQGREEQFDMDGTIPYDVYTDFIIPDGANFAVDVDNGDYLVQMIAGSIYKSNVKATIEGEVGVSVSNGAGSYTVADYTVTVADGQLNIEFAAGAVSRCNGVIIRKIVELADE